MKKADHDKALYFFFMFKNSLSAAQGYDQLNVLQGAVNNVQWHSDNSWPHKASLLVLTQKKHAQYEQLTYWLMRI